LRNQARIAGVDRIDESEFRGAFACVGDVSAGEAVGRGCASGEVDAGNGPALEVVDEDGASGLIVGRQYQQGAVEASRAPERCIDIPRLVGGAEHEDAVVVISDAVEFGEQLVDRGSEVDVPGQRSLRPERVELIQKQDARGGSARELEDVMEVHF